MTRPPVWHLGQEKKMRANPIPKLTPKQANYFWSLVEVYHPAGCWNWTGGVRSYYGRIKINGKAYPAHRVAYAELIGDPATDIHADHLCRNKLCCNPDHIQPKTPRGNTMSGYGPASFNARKTHCKYGHEFTPENTRIGRTGKRACRSCFRERNYPSLKN